MYNFDLRAPGKIGIYILTAVPCKIKTFLLLLLFYLYFTFRNMNEIHVPVFVQYSELSNRT